MPERIAEITRKLHLKEGLLLAALLPGVFSFSTSGGMYEVLIRFAIGFTCIICFWVSVFGLVDFSPGWHRSKSKKKWTIIRGIALSMFFAVALFLAIGFLDGTGVMLSQIKGDLIRSPRAWFFLILRVMLLNALVILLKYFYDFSREKRRIQSEVEQLKQENVMALHESLRQQMNPHFLFNSLNTLKSLIKQSRERSLDFVDELASVYRYMLVHNGKSNVTIGQEMEFLKSYVNLLSIRFGESLRVHLDVSGDVLKARMPANTLQALIENAVKHNILTAKRPLKIMVYSNETHLVVENNLQVKEADETLSSHIGLVNVEKRYNILYGKSIIVNREHGVFRVLLPKA